MDGGNRCGEQCAAGLALKGLEAVAARSDAHLALAPAAVVLADRTTAAETAVAPHLRIKTRNEKNGR